MPPHAFPWPTYFGACFCFSGHTYAIFCSLTTEIKLVRGRVSYFQEGAHMVKRGASQIRAFFSTMTDVMQGHRFSGLGERTQQQKTTSK